MNKGFDIQELVANLNETYRQFLSLASSFAKEEFNVSGAANSWSAAQVCEHVIKSNKAISQAINSKGKTTERKPDQRVLELKELFLNFTAKFQSPESVLPTCVAYNQEMFIEDMQKSRDHLEQLSASINKLETLNVPGFGELTKLELFHFIIVHTQRHYHQLKKIREMQTA